MASIYDLYIEQGSDFSQSLDLSGDYTGSSIGATAEDSEGNSFSGFVSWQDDTEGLVNISISNSITSTMAGGIGRYNIEITDGAGKVDRILQGRIYVDKDV